MTNVTELDGIFKIIDIVQRSTEFVDRGWSYHSTVTLAVVALVYGSEKVRLALSLRRIIAFGYSVFVAGNAVALARAQGSAIRWITLFNSELLKISPPLPITPIHPFPVWQVVSLQIAMSSVVVIAILFAGQISDRLNMPIKSSSRKSRVTDVRL